MREVWCKIVNSKIRVIKMYLEDSAESQSFGWRESSRRAARRRKLSMASHRAGLARRDREKEQNSAQWDGSWGVSKHRDPTETV